MITIAIKIPIPINDSVQRQFVTIQIELGKHRTRPKLSTHVCVCVYSHSSVCCMSRVCVGSCVCATHTCIHASIYTHTCLHTQFIALYQKLLCYSYRGQNQIENSNKIKNRLPITDKLVLAWQEDSPYNRQICVYIS